MKTRIVLGLLLVLVCSFIPIAAQGRYGFVVILDAGHGGKDPGAVGNGGREKDITLAVVKKLGRMIKSNHPEVRVLYTRETDVFVGLQARCDFANKHHGSLFISVHVNSTGKNATPRGTETYVIGMNKQKNNLSVAMRENEVILLEDNYQRTYRGFNPKVAEHYIMFDLMQEAYINQSIGFAGKVQQEYKRSGMLSRGVRQDGLWVLSQSAMPSVLTEVGFISNPTEARRMLSSEGQAEIARSISRAFSTYYRELTGKSRSSSQETTDTKPEVEEIIDTPVGTAPATAATKPNQAKEQGRNDKEVKKQLEKMRQMKARYDSIAHTEYRVQFMSTPERLSTEDKAFARLKQPVYRERYDNLYAYMVGKKLTLTEAIALRKKVRKYYPDAVLVKYLSGQRTETIY